MQGDPLRVRAQRGTIGHMPGWNSPEGKFVKMQGRSEVGTVISPALNSGNVRVYNILIQDTGEVVTYAIDSLTNCNEDGSEIKRD